MLLRIFVFVFAVCGLLAAWPTRAAERPASWVELSADGRLSLRAIAAVGAACPSVTADGVTLPSQPRAAPDNAFPVQVCEALVPMVAARVTFDGATLPALPAQIRRLVVIGDTGCRMQGHAFQDCADSRKWPFPVIAAAAAAKRPDLVIHLGDYLYREAACPADRRGCAGSPHGDTWPTWQADLFDPAAPLLAAAPWVFVRGNHEVCRRSGHGWYRLLDPHPPAPDCADRSEPYWLSAGGLNLLLFDSAAADDFTAPPDEIATYAAQFASLLANAAPHAWLLTHKPVWAMAQADLAGVPMNQTEQAAIRGLVPASLDLVLAGHIHDFLGYEFGGERPAQLVVGTGGDNLLRLGHAPADGVEIDGMTVRRSFATERFGYLLMEQAGEGWDGTFYAPDDSVLARCRLDGRQLACH